MLNYEIPGSTPPKYGFQSSENSRAAVILYQHGDDPIVLNSKKSSESLPLIGNKATDDEPSVISVSTTKTLNEASGSFTVTVKPSRKSKDLFTQITDDDWVDIIFYVNKQPYHIFRGLIDEINRNRTVVNGATVTTYSIIGRCFSKVWESTPVWFSPYYNDIITEAVSSRIFNGVPEFLETPDKAVLSFLKGFLEAIKTAKGANWLPPKSMLDEGSADTFLGNVNFNELLGGCRHFQNIPKRIEFNLNAINPEGMLWDLAKNFSDPTFTELYTDYLPKGDPFNKNLSDPINVGGGEMTVIMRDKPFPVLDTSVPPGYIDTWDNLPVFTVQPQEISDYSVSKGGYERYNAFYVASRIHQEDMQRYALNLIPPLMDADSIKRHGFRRFDVQSNVHPSIDNPITAGGTNVDEMCNYQRQIIRDWYCLNPYMLSGTIITGHGRPDIRIGCRLHIPGVTGSTTEIHPEENYYIESVSNNWSFGSGIKTSIGVTRGWLGDLRSYYDNLNRMSLRYRVADLLDPIGL